MYVLAYAFPCTSKGEEDERNFCGIMNLPNPPQFRHYDEMLLQATEDVCTQITKNTVEVCVCVCVKEIGSINIATTFDGSWHRRGQTQPECGLVTTGKVIDARILTKYCRCIGRLENNPEANYSDISGGQRILDMFRQSQDSHNIK